METFNLSFKDFNENSSNTIRNLFQNEHFSDVTLLSEDGRELKLHKVILASSSKTFSKILSRMNHPSPSIYLKGINFKDLKSIIKFLYTGETQVLEEDFKSFMDIAKDLEINGLLDFNVEKSVQIEKRIAETDDVFLTPSKKKKRVKFLLETNQNEENFEINENEYQVTIDTSINEDEDCFSYITSAESLSSSMLDHPQSSVHDSSKYPCSTCDQSYTRQDNLQRHLKLAHGELLL